MDQCFGLGEQLGLLAVKLRFGVKESLAATPVATIFGFATSDSHRPRVESSGGGAGEVGAVVDVKVTSSVKS